MALLLRWGHLPAAVGWTPAEIFVGGLRSDLGRGRQAGTGHKAAAIGTEIVEGRSGGLDAFSDPGPAVLGAVAAQKRSAHGARDEVVAAGLVGADEMLAGDGHVSA